MSSSDLITNRIKGTGWVPDVPDHRDYLYGALTGPDVKLDELPPKVDLRDNVAMQFPILDQGNLGSCTANSIAATITYCQNKQANKLHFYPSRLFIYYDERNSEGTVSSDSGAMIRDGIKSVNAIGVCSEDTWPYDIQRFTIKPSPKAYCEALQHQALQYRRIPDNDLNLMKACLASGFPFVFGFAVYESFESLGVARTGVVPLPKIQESMLGGHAVLAVGYDDSKEQFIIRNSWGDKWGDKGYFYLPYQYLQDQNLSDDFWVITLMEEQDTANNNQENEL